jgi:hypothetical protein
MSHYNSLVYGSFFLPLALLEFNQSVMVNRKNPESRKQAIAQIIERLTSNGYWPQVSSVQRSYLANGGNRSSVVRDM